LEERSAQNQPHRVVARLFWSYNEG
jgi:hypothetical protein